MGRRRLSKERQEKFLKQRAIELIEAAVAVDPKNRKSEGVPMQFQITYLCNASCRNCCQNIDVLPWNHCDTHMTIPEVREVARRVHNAGIQVGKLAIAGGEPTIHPQFRPLVEEIIDQIKPTWKTRIYTNAKVKRAKVPKTKYMRVGLDDPRKQFASWRWSPADLGIEPVGIGVTRPCGHQSRCGQSVDKFGFTFCPLAGMMGYVIDKDPYSTRPVKAGTMEFCQHCPMSVGRKKKTEIDRLIVEGKVNAVTKTYREGIERRKEEPWQPPTLMQRIKQEDYLTGSIESERPSRPSYQPVPVHLRTEYPQLFQITSSQVKAG